MALQLQFEQIVGAQPVGREDGLAGLAKANQAQLRLATVNELAPLDLEHWDELGQKAATQSVYAQPWFMRHSLTQCDPEGAAVLAIVEVADGKWLGALPITRARQIGRAPVPCWQAWSHYNRFVGTPLVAEGAAYAFWQCLLTGLGQSSPRELALCLPDLALDDPVTQTLFDICSTDGRLLVLDRRYARPLLQPGEQFKISPKQRRRNESLLRKLANDLAPPQFRLIRDPVEISARIEPFLILEQSGWKGASGSALACSQQNRALFTQIIEDAAERGCCEMAELSVGDEVLALSTQLIGNGRSYGFKAAYAENHAAYAPGLLLLDWLTSTHLADPAALPLDSCASPGQQPVSRMWQDRCELVDCRIALGGDLRLGLMRTLLAGEAAYTGLKRMLPGLAPPHKP